MSIVYRPRKEMADAATYKAYVADLNAPKLNFLPAIYAIRAHPDQHEGVHFNSKPRDLTCNAGMVPRVSTQADSV